MKSRSCASLLLFAFLSSLTTAARADTLRFGDTIVLGRSDRGSLALLSTDDPTIRFIETADADFVICLSIDQASTVIVVGPQEERIVRLRSRFADPVLRGTELAVEVLQGHGTVKWEATELQLRTEATQPARRRAVAPPAARPPSMSLIDRAEESGAISSETALLYRVYSIFGDARLPSQYRGDDTNVLDSLYLDKVRERFASLSPATQDALTPFLVPPAYSGSWANAAGSAITPLAVPPPCQTLSAWFKVDTKNNLVRIWYRAGSPDAQRANAIAASIDSPIWPKISGLMTGHLPVSDLSEDCNGTDGRLDIYLTDIPRSVTIPYKACDHSPQPVFIVLKRTTTDAIVAHEIFHAFQDAYALAGCSTDDKYLWWSEASAEWVQDFVFTPSNSGEEQYTAPAFLNFPEKELYRWEENTNHQYGAYLLPFYVQHKTGSPSVVPQSWEKMANQSALEALDNLVPGGFKTTWPEFTKFNWNRGPVEDYKNWDGLTAGARQSPISVHEGAGTVVFDIKTDLAPLSAAYNYFIFTEEDASVVFWNGMTRKLSERDLGLGPQYVSDDANPDDTKGAHITALIRMGDSWKEEDWTDKPFVMYCRDLLAERIDALVLILSNSEFKDPGRRLTPPGLAPVLHISNMGCWKWKGTASISSFGFSANANVTFTRPDVSEGPFEIQYDAQGVVEYTLSSPGCSVSGSVPVAADRSALYTYNSAPLDNPIRRIYDGFGAAIAGGCGAPPGTVWTWLDIPGALSEKPKVSADGRVIDGSYTPPGSPGGYIWHFVAQRE